jgi:hypothetical protein
MGLSSSWSVVRVQRFAEEGDRLLVARLGREQLRELLERGLEQAGRAGGAQEVDGGAEGGLGIGWAPALSVEAGEGEVGGGLGLGIG